LEKNMAYPRTTLIASLIIGSLALAACDKTSVTSKPITNVTTTPSSNSTEKSVSTPTTVAMRAQLSGTSEVPPTKSMGSGTVDATFDKQSNVLTWTITYSGLSGPATAGHFHGPAAAGANAPPSLPLSGSLDSPIKGTATLTAAQASDLTAGNWYINLHTAMNPDGEIRGQVMAKP
jgi:CHRD domain